METLRRFWNYRSTEAQRLALLRVLELPSAYSWYAYSRLPEWMREQIEESWYEENIDRGYADSIAEQHER